MTLHVFGITGQVATELRALAPVTALGRDRVDLADPTACATAIHAHRPRALINAEAYTAFDRAETEEDLATRINADAPPGAMAWACADPCFPFVHISTDYVFAGDGEDPWRPSDPTGPLGAYGRSKLAGETAVRAAGGSHAILRTFWVFSAHGNNFLKTMLRLGPEREMLNLVADQIGGPTPARAIAAACLTIAEKLSKSSTPPATTISQARPTRPGPVSPAASLPRQSFPAGSWISPPAPILRMPAAPAIPALIAAPPARSSASTGPIGRMRRARSSSPLHSAEAQAR